MNRLRTAIAMLAGDTRLRTEVKAQAKTIPPGAKTPPDQPDPAALRQIDALFRQQNLYLSVYDLAEINRWMVIDNNSSGQVSALLDQYWAAVGSIPGITAANRGSFQEAAAVLMVDPDLRNRFIGRTDDLSKRGFTFDAGVEENLRAAVTPPSVGNIADAFVKLTWPGMECFSRLDFYAAYDHPNR